MGIRKKPVEPTVFCVESQAAFGERPENGNQRVTKLDNQIDFFYLEPSKQGAKHTIRC